MLGTISRNIITLTVNLFFLGEVEGLEHLPNEGPYLIVANHASFMDHFVIAALLKKYRRERVYYLTKKESFDKLLSRVWHLSVGCIPLNRNAADTAAFRTTIRYLQDGKIVCIYPEGTRTSTGFMNPGKAGAVKFAAIAKVPIVPIGMQHTFDILPKNRLLPRLLKASVRIGEPIELSKSNHKPDIEQVNSHIMDQLAELSMEMGTRYTSTADEQGQTPNTDELLQIAADWIDTGMRRHMKSPLPERLLYRRAIYMCEEMLSNEPSNADALMEMGRALGRLALISSPINKILLALKAKKCFEKSLIIKPSLAKAHYSLGMWHLTIPSLFGANLNLSLKYYKDAVMHAPHEIYIRVGLANCYFKLGQIEQCYQAYQEALHLDSMHREDDRRKLEIMAQLLRMNPQMTFESRLIQTCFVYSHTG